VDGTTKDAPKRNFFSVLPLFLLKCFADDIGDAMIYCMEEDGPEADGEGEDDDVRDKQVQPEAPLMDNEPVQDLNDDTSRCKTI